jgi:hypothetical protein
MLKILQKPGLALRLPGLRQRLCAEKLTEDRNING